MTIAEQLALFYRRYGETQNNSRITPEDALARINDARRHEALETKFYDIKDSIGGATAEGAFRVLGGEGYFTMRPDFYGIWEKSRDSVTRNGIPVTIKTFSEWNSITGLMAPIGAMNGESYGMMHGNTFYIYPPAVANEEFIWWGYGAPPALGAITGPDAYLNDNQAELTVLSAVIDAKEDIGAQASQSVHRRHAELRKLLTRRTPRGPILDPAPY